MCHCEDKYILYIVIVILNIRKECNKLCSSSLSVVKLRSCSWLTRSMKCFGTEETAGGQSRSSWRSTGRRSRSKHSWSSKLRSDCVYPLIPFHCDSAQDLNRAFVPSSHSCSTSWRWRSRRWRETRRRLHGERSWSCGESWRERLSWSLRLWWAERRTPSRGYRNHRRYWVSALSTNTRLRQTHHDISNGSHDPDRGKRDVCSKTSPAERDRVCAESRHWAETEDGGLRQVSTAAYLNQNMRVLLPLRRSTSITKRQLKVK